MRKQQNAELTALWNKYHGNPAIDYGSLVEEASALCLRWGNDPYVAEAIARFYMKMEEEWQSLKV